MFIKKVAQILEVSVTAAPIGRTMWRVHDALVHAVHISSIAALQLSYTFAHLPGIIKYGIIE